MDYKKKYLKYKLKYLTAKKLYGGMVVFNEDPDEEDLDNFVPENLETLTNDLQPSVEEELVDFINEKSESQTQDKGIQIDPVNKDMFNDPINEDLLKTLHKKSVTYDSPIKKNIKKKTETTTRLPPRSPPPYPKTPAEIKVYLEKNTFEPDTHERHLNALNKHIEYLTKEIKAGGTQQDINKYEFRLKKITEYTDKYSVSSEETQNTMRNEATVEMIKDKIRKQANPDTHERHLNALNKHIEYLTKEIKAGDTPQNINKYKFQLQKITEYIDKYSVSSKETQNTMRNKANAEMIKDRIRTLAKNMMPLE